MALLQPACNSTSNDIWFVMVIYTVSEHFNTKLYIWYRDWRFFESSFVVAAEYMATQYACYTLHTTLWRFKLQIWSFKSDPTPFQIRSYLFNYLNIPVVFIRPFEKRTYYAVAMSVRPSVRPSVSPGFPDFSSTCFEISIWNLVYTFSRWHDM